MNLDKLSWKKSALVRYKILGLFVNTLTAEYTYSRRNMQYAITFKTKDFFWIFYCLSEIYMKWRTYAEKTLTQQVQTPLSLKQKTLLFWIFYLLFWNDCRVHVFSSQYADFDATSSDAIIFKTKGESEN